MFLSCDPSSTYTGTFLRFRRSSSRESPSVETGTMAEIPPAAKNRISHRARALRAAEPFLLQIFGLAVQDQVDAGGK